jgi:hypothetical protein
VLLKVKCVFFVYNLSSFAKPAVWFSSNGLNQPGGKERIKKKKKKLKIVENRIKSIYFALRDVSHNGWQTQVLAMIESVIKFKRTIGLFQRCVMINKK